MSVNADELAKIESANKTLKKNNLPFKAVRLVKNQGAVRASTFEFMSLDESNQNSKVCTLTGFLYKPTLNTGSKGFIHPENVDGIQKRHEQISKRYEFEDSTENCEVSDEQIVSLLAEQFPNNEVEFISKSSNGILVRLNYELGHVRRYKTLQPILDLDINFNPCSKGQFYLVEQFVEDGYTVECEYTIPGSQSRIDIAVWTPDHKRLLFFVEYDGVQHYQKADYFGDTDDDFEMRQFADNSKNEFALSIGVPLYRVSDPGGKFYKDGVRAVAKKILESFWDYKLIHLPFDISKTE